MPVSNADMLTRRSYPLHFLSVCWNCRQLFESAILRKAQARQDSYANIEFYSDLVVIAVATSVLARIGYYCVYGKNSGAKALPPRS